MLNILPKSSQRRTLEKREEAHFPFPGEARKADIVTVTWRVSSLRTSLGKQQKPPPNFSSTGSCVYQAVVAGLKPQATVLPQRSADKGLGTRAL